MTRSKTPRAVANAQTPRIAPRAKATLTNIPGHAIATIEGREVALPPGTPVDTGGTVMIIERVFGIEADDELVYVLLRRPAFWTFDGLKSTARIQGWPDELRLAVPELRGLPAAGWREQQVVAAAGAMVGRIIAVEELNVRALAVAVDSVLSAKAMDRPDEWRIDLALNRIGGTYGF